MEKRPECEHENKVIGLKILGHSAFVQMTGWLTGWRAMHLDCVFGFFP